MEDLDNGQLEFSYVLTAVGSYSISVVSQSGGTHLSGSPATVNVQIGARLLRTLKMGHPLSGEADG